MSDEIKLDVLKTEMLKNISEIDFRDFFAKASKCSGDNARILLIVKPETYERIAQTPFLKKEYFHFLVEAMRDKIHDNMELVVKMPKANNEDEDEDELSSITLGDELGLDELDDLEDLEDLSGIDGFDDEDETQHLTFLSTRKLKVLLVVENKDDYLCIRRWALSKLKDTKEKIKILTLDKNGIKELFEEDYHKVLKKSMDQKISVANLGEDKDSEEFKKFSEVMIALKKNISPSEDEVNSFIDFMLVDEELFIKDGVFLIKSFSTIPSFVTKNFGLLTQRIKENVSNKDAAFKGQIETIQKTIAGLDDDKDLSFFILGEIVKDMSFLMIKKLYLSNEIVEAYMDEVLDDFDEVMSIFLDVNDKKTPSLRLTIKDILIPYLNTGWSNIDSLDEDL